MKMLFIRHSEAQHSSPDEQRELTNYGREYFGRNCKVLGLYTNIDYIITSPLIRAKQTAEILNSSFPNAKTFTDESLVPGSRIDDILIYCNSLEAETVALVGHQPDMSEHVSQVCSGSYVNIAVSPGTIMGVEYIGKAELGKGFIRYVIPGV